MAYTTINKSGDYFNTKLYAGNSGTQSITGVGFQPDFLWIKRRTNAGDHNLVDVIRTSDKTLISNSTGAEYSNSTITSFDSDGFSLSGSDGALNASSNDYASWNWLANGAGSANTDGSINTTATSVNTTAGFSISKYTGNATSGATVGHGLGTTPSVIIVKKTSGSDGWVVYHHKNTSAPATEYLRLDTSDATADNLGEWNDTAPSSTVFTIGNSGRTNDNGATYIAYCFAEKTGYSKFGSYTGNGNSDGPFIYTGFKPAFVMTKKTSGTSSWDIHDTKRDTYNVASKYLLAEDSGAEGNTAILDILSNGFKFRSSNGDRNASGGTYIYMAFAEEPLIGDNPATAR